MADDDVKMFAKMRGRNGEHKVVFTGGAEIKENGLLLLPDVDDMRSHEVDFNSEYSLESDEWFYVSVDDEHVKMIDGYMGSFGNTAALSIIDSSDYTKVEVLYTVWADTQGRPSGIVFQKVVPSKKIVGRKGLFLNDRPAVKHIEAHIEVTSLIDAYYDCPSRKIYFRSFPTIRCIFAGIDDYYRVATELEVDKIKQSGYLCFGAEFSPGMRNLKKIAQLIDANTLGSPEFRESFDKYLPKYNLDNLAVNDGGIVVNNDKELGVALSLLQGRYYTSELTGEKTLAIQAQKVEEL